MVTRGGCGAGSRCISGREEMSVMGENTVKGSLDISIASTDICKEKGHTHVLSVTC